MELESSTLTIVAERAGNPIAVLQERNDRAFHVHVDRLMNRVVLERADHLETRAITDVREPRVFMSAEISLQNASVRCAVEHGPPSLELSNAVRRFLRVQLGHPPVVEI